MQPIIPYAPRSNSHIHTLLCSLGANPNLANCGSWGDNVIGDISEGTTPLWIAAEKTTNLELIKMLRKYGAVVYLKLSETGQAMIDLDGILHIR